jgi:hypothetical protein
LEKSKQPQGETERMINRVKGSQAEFIVRELDIGLTFAYLARRSLIRGQSKNADRQRTAATRAHGAVLKFLPTATLPPDQKKGIEGQLAELESRLQRLADLHALLSCTSRSPKTPAETFSIGKRIRELISHLGAKVYGRLLE